LLNLNDPRLAPALEERQRKGKMKAELTALKTDGTIFPIEISSTIFIDSKGEERTSMLIRDLTEKKKAEDAIKASEEKYRTLVEQASDAIFIADTTGRFITVNTSACKLSQYSESALLQMSIYDFAVMEDIQKNPFHFDELKQGKTVSTERLMKRRDNVQVHVEIVAKFLSDGRLLVFVRDISERKKAEEEIKTANEQLRQLTAHLQTVREEERKRIGREIHDELGQQLTAMKMDVAWIDKNIPAEQVPLKDKLNNIIKLLDGGNQSIRKILHELRPDGLENHALNEALEWQGRQFTQTTGIPVEFTPSEKIIQLPDQVATCIFRVYQESLTNIMRHAKAGKVLTSLKLTDDSVVLAIEDDGIGFEPEAVQSKKTFGILGMKERVLALNGTFELVSSQGKGTKIVISLPYKA
ncbi:MAG TPA: PAS domain-containing sensor histidine kinase, partial [Chitinophagaceae bacterium]|nr:PAS domain-containing sensor histidine kinase [Chitinophagaceae bacterium]